MRALRLESLQVQFASYGINAAQYASELRGPRWFEPVRSIGCSSIHDHPCIFLDTQMFAYTYSVSLVCFRWKIFKLQAMGQKPSIKKSCRTKHGEHMDRGVGWTHGPWCWVTFCCFLSLLNCSKEIWSCPIHKGLICWPNRHLKNYRPRLRKPVVSRPSSSRMEHSCAALKRRPWVRGRPLEDETNMLLKFLIFQDNEHESPQNSKLAECRSRFSSLKISKSRKKQRYI